MDQALGHRTDDLVVTGVVALARPVRRAAQLTRNELRIHDQCCKASSHALALARSTCKACSCCALADLVMRSRRRASLYTFVEVNGLPFFGMFVALNTCTCTEQLAPVRLTSPRRDRQRAVGTRCRWGVWGG